MLGMVIFLYTKRMVEPTTKIIRFPKLLTIGWSHVLFKRCAEALAYHGGVTLDFGDVEWAAPFGLTVVSVTLAKCLQQKKRVYYSPPTNAAFKDYLERIGFKYHFLSGQAVAHRKTSVELKQLRGLDPGCATAIVELISHDFPLSGDVKFGLKTHINELMTNGFDHSESTVGCYVCAQWYPTQKNLRISFADGGIGIFQSLKRSRLFPNINTDVEAIKLAVKPGITTREERRGGFGLDYIRRYVRNNNGTLTIISGEGKVNFYTNKVENKLEEIGFHGTVVDIKISPTAVKKARRKTDDLF